MERLKEDQDVVSESYQTSMLSPNIPEVCGIGLHAQFSNPGYTLDKSGYISSPKSEDQRDFVTAITSAATSVSKSPSFFQRVLAVFKENVTTIANLLAVLFILFLEIILKQNLFICPCDGSNTLYAVVFIMGPATTLFAVSMLTSNITWQLNVGCVRRSPEAAHGCRNGCYYMTMLLSRSLLGPMVWIIYAFIDGNFYHCARAKDPCGNSTSEEFLKDKKHLVGESQIIGFVMLITIPTTCLIILLIFRAFSKLTFEQFNYRRIYSNVERVELQKQFEEHAQNRARRNVLFFLDKEIRTKEDWDKLAAPVMLGQNRDQQSNQESWTPLQKLVKKERSEKQRKPSVTTQTSGGSKL